MRTSALEGAALDYWAGRAAGKKVEFDSFGITYAKKMFCSTELTCWSPSRFWEQGGPIIERERISIVDIKATKSDMWIPQDGEFSAFIDSVRCLDSWDGRKSFDDTQTGSTPLIAAMRAFVASKYGETVPDDMAQHNTQQHSTT